MMLSLLRDDATVLPFMEANAPMGAAKFVVGQDSGWAVMRSDGVAAALIVLSDWKPCFASIEFSMIALKSHALSQNVVRQLGEYVFGHLGCNRVTARTSSRNWRARRILEHQGFRREGTFVDFYGPGSNADNYRLLKREWDEMHAQKEAA